LNGVGGDWDCNSRCAEESHAPRGLGEVHGNDCRDGVLVGLDWKRIWVIFERCGDEEVAGLDCNISIPSSKLHTSRKQPRIISAWWKYLYRFVALGLLFEGFLPFVDTFCTATASGRYRNQQVLSSSVNKASATPPKYISAIVILKGSKLEYNMP
jgi:hypothetical protein